ncbi:MAG: hypothetical protein K2I30_06985 [Clostridia bacterium]|nr:hypothetical protein [Clostridia bacterium]
MIKKECCRCNMFEAYFTKAYCCFLRTNCGYCYKNREIVKKHSTCESWRYKKTDKEIKRTAVIKELNEVVTKVNILIDFVNKKE